MKTTLCLGLLAAGAAFVCAGERNVILIIGDGAGISSWEMHRLYRGESDSETLCGSNEWTYLHASTYPLNLSETPCRSGVQDSSLVYSSAYAWDSDQKGQKYPWRKRHTDSAAAATALSTGQKTYNSAISVDDFAKPVPTLAEQVKAHGFGVGVITTVPISHATPAGFSGAHVPKRTMYSQITQQVIADTVVDVWFGAGNPDYAADGFPAGEKNYDYVGGRNLYTRLLNDQIPGWKLFLLDTRFDALEAFDSRQDSRRILGLLPALTTVQHDRPAGTPRRSMKSSLPEMSKLALHHLAKHEKGFFLMIEAGAIDWANHANNPERMLEEFEEMRETVGAVCERLDKRIDGNGWDNTLVIVTADHETGLILGPDGVNPYADIRFNGKNSIPGHRYHSTNHSNMIVPVRLRGKDMQKVFEFVRGSDSVYGDYIDNTDIYKLMRRSLLEK